MARDLPLHDVSSARKTIERAAPFAWRLLRRLGVADRDAHDVCHEVFVVVHRKLAHIGTPTSIRSFVYAVCVRAASDYRRSARVRRERLSDEIDEAEEAWFS